MITIHVVGDSISMDYGPYLEQYLGHQYQYSRKTGSIGNLDDPGGANGGDSSMVLAYLQQCQSAGCNWDVLVLNCGLHDLKLYKKKYQVSLRKYKANLQEVFKLSHHLARKTIWVRTTPVIDEIHNTRKNEFKRFNADVDKYNTVADRITALLGDWTIDLNRFSRLIDMPEIYRDHVHFIEEVYRLQGAFIAGQLIAFSGLWKSNIR
jgi:hypothetical protein